MDRKLIRGASRIIGAQSSHLKGRWWGALGSSPRGNASAPMFFTSTACEARYHAARGVA